MSASGHALRDRKSLVTSDKFAFDEVSLVDAFFKSASGWLLKVYNLALEITAESAFFAFSMRSFNALIGNMSRFSETGCNFWIHDLTGVQSDKLLTLIKTHEGGLPVTMLHRNFSFHKGFMDAGMCLWEGCYIF